MTLDVKVVPGARRPRIEIEGGTWKVYLSSPPVDGRANEGLIEALAEHFGVRRSRITIIKGLRSRNKTVNVAND